MSSPRPAEPSRRVASGAVGSRSAARSPPGPDSFTTLSPDLHQSAPHRPEASRKTRHMNLKGGTITRIALVVGLLAFVAGCGGGRGGDDEAGATTTAANGGSDLSGRIEADGSSTVGPYTTAAAEKFQSENADVQVTVGVSGTGGGFERFCRGETDLSNASRPIKDEEATACENAGVDFVEFQIANDALTVVVNTDNDWATCLTVEELNAMWKPGSTVENWNQVRDDFPDEP